MSVHVGFVVNKVALGHVFSWYLGFPYQFLFHKMVHAFLSSGSGTIIQLAAGVPSGLSLTLPNHIKNNNALHVMM
jgi:hypothetical protein